MAVALMTTLSRGPVLIKKDGKNLNGMEWSNLIGVSPQYGRNGLFKDV